MKKVISLILVAIFCCFLFAACDSSEKNNFESEKGKCIVTLPDSYDLSFESDVDVFVIQSEKINGQQREDGFNYFSIPCGEPFRILTPLSVTNEKNSNSQTLKYWKVNDILYKDNDSYLSENTFICYENTKIIPLYYEFRAVGMLLQSIEYDDFLELPEDYFFDEEGNLKDRKDIFYFYGDYEFNPDKDSWKTNLTLKGFSVSYIADNNDTSYELAVEIDAKNFSGKGSVVIRTLYKIDDHGYMFYSAYNVITSDDFTGITSYCPLGENRIKYTFAS